MRSLVQEMVGNFTKVGYTQFTKECVACFLMLQIYSTVEDFG
jgi:hypothetical protein